MRVKEVFKSWATFLYLKAHFLSGIYVIAQSTIVVN